MVIDAARCSGRWDVVAVLDDSPRLTGGVVLGVPVHGTIESISEFEGKGMSVVVAIGSNQARQDIQAGIRHAGFAIATVLHPAAAISSSASLGEGCVVMAGVVVNAETRLGEGVIVNTGASIDHDCFVADFAHVAPGASLCGGVKVGPRTLVGVGVSVIPNVSIGADCTVAAGAAVTRDVVDGVCAAGVPARRIK